MVTGGGGSGGKPNSGHLDFDCTFDITTLPAVALCLSAKPMQAWISRSLADKTHSGAHLNSGVPEYCYRLLELSPVGRCHRHFVLILHCDGPCAYG